MTTTSISEVRGGQHQLANFPDQAVDMFTERGFALANRIAKAYASSDAVPAQFRAMNMKKVGKEEHWVENTSAIGNCLVAIEVARAVRMSIAAVMQNADMIEGKLRWSGKFVIAAINASGRFTPLRFQMFNRGPIKATFKEKTGWDNEARRPTFTERVVEVENVECIAWALPKGVPEPHLTAEQVQKFPGRLLDLYKALGMPVIESAPVTMRMVVEEGWYGKAGSKWQTELRQLMFMYRAGSFFGNIHAPDIVMGMGQTAEEARDLAGSTWEMAADGNFVPTPVSELRPPAPGPVPPADIVEPRQTAQANEETGEVPPPPPAAPKAAGAAGAAGAPAPAKAPPAPTPTFDVDAFAERLERTQDLDTLDALGDQIRSIADRDAAATLGSIYDRRRDELTTTGGTAQAPAAPAPAARRTRAAAGQQSIE